MSNPVTTPTEHGEKEFYRCLAVLLAVAEMHAQHAGPMLSAVITHASHVVEEYAVNVLGADA